MLQDDPSQKTSSLDIRGRPALDRETVSATQALVEAGLMAGQAVKQRGIGRATDYRIARAAR